jgi:hypothetical protein
MTNDSGRENISGALSWIVEQATDGMHTAAGAATTHGDDSGALEMLHRILSDIAINAGMALDAMAPNVSGLSHTGVDRG